MDLNSEMKTIVEQTFTKNDISFILLSEDKKESAEREKKFGIYSIAVNGVAFDLMVGYLPDPGAEKGEFSFRKDGMKEIEIKKYLFDDFKEFSQELNKRTAELKIKVRFTGGEYYYLPRFIDKINEFYENRLNETSKRKIIELMKMKLGFTDTDQLEVALLIWDLVPLQEPQDDKIRFYKFPDKKEEVTLTKKEIGLSE